MSFRNRLLALASAAGLAAVCGLAQADGAAVDVGVPVFQGVEPQRMTVGFVAGEEEPYQTWNGVINGRSAYVELNDGKWRLQLRRKWARGDLSKALREPGEQYLGLDAKGTDIYVVPGRIKAGVLLCLESPPNGASRDTSHMAVFVFSQFVGKSVVHQLPATNASCRGLTRDSKGNFFAPSDVAGANGRRTVRLTVDGFVPA